MDSPIATVISAASRRATVEVEAAAVCARCAAGKGCGAGLFGAGRRAVRIDVDVAANLSLAAGERVYLLLEPVNLLKATWLAYGLPLLGLVAGAGLVWSLRNPAGELATVAGAIAGLLAGLVLGRWYLGQHACLRHFVPYVRSRVSETRQPAP